MHVMPCFAMIWSCSMLISCSKHCFLMLIPDMLVFSLSVWSWYLLHFYHACLNLLLCDLAIAQCSSFVKHLEYITFICFLAMLECSSLVSCCILDGIVLLIVELCHYCFACHLQTVHPFPVIFISISTNIISSFQWHSWFAKLLPCSFFFFRSTHTHRISYLAYHACIASCCLCISRDWLWFHCLCSCCG